MVEIKTTNLKPGVSFWGKAKINKGIYMANSANKI